MRKALVLLVLLAVVFGVSRVGAQPAVVKYYHLDGVGNVRAISDAAGQVIERHEYLPFGEERNPQPSGDARKFTGKERDSETGFDYFGARYYGSEMGRFTTVDPVYTWRDNLNDPQRWNRYAYGRNNPLRYLDPDGKIVLPVIVAIAVFAILTAPDIANAPGPGDPTYKSDQTGQLIVQAAVAAGTVMGVDYARRALDLLRMARTETGDAPPTRPGDIETIGRPGKGKDVREVQGSAKDAENLFRELSKGGKPVEKPGYPGRATELPDGTFVGYRPESKSGPPTVDVGLPGREGNIKVKFVKE